jgi:membrane-associated phospholipid phosphatase
MEYKSYSDYSEESSTNSSINAKEISNSTENHKKKKQNFILKFFDYYDKKLSNYIYNLEFPPKLEFLIYLNARIYNPDLIILYFLILLIYNIYYNDDYYFIIKPLIHVITVLLFCLLFKYIIGRHRPKIKNLIKRKYNCRMHEHNYSMPSGDAAQSGNFAFLILYYYNSYFGFFLIPLVMFARVFYFCHYIFDTVVGTLIGFFVSYYISFPLKNVKFNK